jgi:hypothetical protein
MSAVADRAERRWWTFDVRSIAMVFATNTTLFCALDLAQWLADRYDLSTLPTNLVAAVIATALGLVFAARSFGGDPPSPARAVRRGQPFAGRCPLVPRRLGRAPVHAARSGNARTAALRPSSQRSRPSGVARHRRPSPPNT